MIKSYLSSPFLMLAVTYLYNKNMSSGFIYNGFKVETTEKPINRETDTAVFLDSSIWMYFIDKLDSWKKWHVILWRKGTHWEDK